MSRRYIASAVLILAAFDLFAADNIIRQDRPARDWQSECLPIGNGRLGCMIYGHINREHIQFNEDTVWIGDQEDTGSYQAFGDLFIEFGESATSAGLRNPSGHSTTGGESLAKSIDGSPSTKWCMEHKGKSVVWQMDYAVAPAEPLQGYAFTSANDLPDRDPRKWKLEGSNDRNEWTLLDEQESGPFAKRHMTKRFSFNNDDFFSSYRFTFEPLDKSHFQVAEIELAGLDVVYSPGDYQRELDVDQAIHSIAYEKDGINYKRKYFASHPADVLVFQLTADQQDAYSGTISLKDAHDGPVKAAGNVLSFSGTLSGKYRKPEENYAIRLQYEAQVFVMNEGGSLQAADGKITFKDCDSLLILLAGGTDYLNQHNKGWKREHPHQRITEQLAKASKRTFDELLVEHVNDYRALFSRVTLELGDTPDETRNLPTSQRLDAYRGALVAEQQGTTYERDALNLKGGSPDPDLEELIFNVARYLMISSSRPGCMPANLQGLWNQSNSPPWRSDYHSDVNIQMNYWFVDHANLSDCFTPLSEWLYSVVPVKREATKKAFGVRGWAHRAENGIFGGSSFKWYLGDGAWIMQNIWDHYAFTRDQEYLETRAYPLLKELCEFWEDTLIEWPDGKLVSPKSQSPEHGPEMEGNSYEQQLVYDLFTNYIEAANELGWDEEFRKKVVSMRSRLLGPQTGEWGQLQEWAEDRDDPNDKHRHLSHLIAVHPGRQIAPLTTPELAKAARVSLNARGDGGTGWSKAWKISMWARLHDGNRAYKLLKEQIHGNFYGNLLSFHPPFQIDGNFGYAAGICEMLVQSQTGVVHLLPSLPNTWASGNVTGLKARGGFVVDIAWKDGELTAATIRSLNGRPLKVTYGDQSVEMETEKDTTYKFNRDLRLSTTR